MCTVTGCSVAVHRDKNDIYSCGGQVEHDHESNLDLILTTYLRQRMSRGIFNELTPISVIYEEEIMRASLNDSALATL